MTPAQRPELTLTQPGEAGNCVQRRISFVRELLLDVFMFARPSPAAVDVASLARRSGEREDLLGVERLRGL